MSRVGRCGTDEQAVRSAQSGPSSRRTKACSRSRAGSEKASSELSWKAAALESPCPSRRSAGPEQVADARSTLSLTQPSR